MEVSVGDDFLPDTPLLFEDIFSPERCSVRPPRRGSVLWWCPVRDTSPTCSPQQSHPPLVPNTCTLLTDTVSHFRGQSLTLLRVGDSKAFTCTTGGFQL